MAADLRQAELNNISDYYIPSVTLPDGQQMTVIFFGSGAVPQCAQTESCSVRCLFS